jgi:hypothetical protein
MMSSAMKFKDHDGDNDAVETSLSLLKAMRDDGNVPAVDYYGQLVLLKGDLERAQELMHGTAAKTDTAGGAVNDTGGDSNGLHDLLVAASTSFDNVGNGTMSHEMAFSAIENFDTGAALDDPFLQGFLAQQQPYVAWDADPSLVFPSEDLSGQWTFDWEDANLFGTI